MTTSLPHDRKEFFTTTRYWEAVESFFSTELLNDGEDITANFCIPKEKNCNASIIAKSEGILAGREELVFFLKKFFPAITTIWEKKEGEKINKTDVIISFSGNARQILKLERVFLNTLSRMSGIATMTKKITKLASPTAIAATRKTQWSYLDKKAVHIGEGLTHRMGLFDAILIKENHQIITNYQLPITNEKTSIRHSCGGGNLPQGEINISSFFEIEVETEKEFIEVYKRLCNEKFFAKDLQKVIMLDNFSAENISNFLKSFPSKKERRRKNIFLEASGGITEKNIEKYALCGVDVISLGALTHSVLPLDFSLRITE